MMADIGKVMQGARNKIKHCHYYAGEIMGDFSSLLLECFYDIFWGYQLKKLFLKKQFKANRV